MFVREVFRFLFARSGGLPVLPRSRSVLSSKMGEGVVGACATLNRLYGAMHVVWLRCRRYGRRRIWGLGSSTPMWRIPCQGTNEKKKKICDRFLLTFCYLSLSLSLTRLLSGKSSYISFGAVPFLPDRFYHSLFFISFTWQSILVRFWGGSFSFFYLMAHFFYAPWIS